MKSLIIIISTFLVATEIQFTLCDDTSNNVVDSIKEEDKTTNNVDDSIKDKDDTANNVVDTITDETDANITIDDAVITQADSISGAAQKEIESPINIEEMKQNLADYRVPAVKYEKTELDKVMTDVENLQNELANMQRQDALNMIEDQRTEAKAVIKAVKKEAWKKLKGAKNIINEKYKNDPEVSAVHEKLKKALEERDAAYDAAEAEFEKIRKDMEKQKQNLQSGHEEALEKGTQQRQKAVKSAKRRLSKARDAFRANRNRNMPSEAKEKLRKTFREEKNAYQQSVKSAENEWQELLNTLGIGEQIRQCDEAIEKAENEKDLAEEKAHSIYKAAYDEHKKLSKEAKKKKRAAKKLAEAEYFEFRDEIQNEYNKILQKLREMKNK